jgi:hypothetical protein
VPFHFSNLSPSIFFCSSSPFIHFPVVFISRYCAYSSFISFTIVPSVVLVRRWLVNTFSDLCTGCIQSSSVESYFTTGGLPPIRSSWRQASWRSRPESVFFFCNWAFTVIVLVKHPLFFSYKYAWLLSNVRIAHILHNWKFFLLQDIQILLNPGFVKQIMPVLFILCYNGSLVNWTVVSLTAAKFKPLIFSVWLRLVLYCKHGHSPGFVAN